MSHTNWQHLSNNKNQCTTAHDENWLQWPHEQKFLKVWLNTVEAIVDFRANNEGKMFSPGNLSVYQMTMWRQVRVAFQQISELIWSITFMVSISVQRNAVTLVRSCLFLPYVELHLFPQAWHVQIGITLLALIFSSSCKAKRDWLGKVIFRCNLISIFT